jgi:hypothetical protein
MFNTLKVATVGMFNTQNIATLRKRQSVKQAGAELCQAQEKLGLANLALPCKLWLSSIENNKKTMAIFH